MNENLERVSEFIIGTGSKVDFVSGLLAVTSEASTFVPHPLGFLRLTLGKSSHGLVYLHCWPGHERYLQSPDLVVHQHSVRVLSYVILGSLQDIAYDWIESPVGGRRLLEQNRQKEGPRLIPTDRVGDVVIRQKRTIEAGRRYLIPQEQFHETVVDWKARIATAVVFEGRSDRPPFVAAPINGSGPRNYEMVLVEEEGERLLRTIRAALAES